MSWATQKGAEFGRKLAEPHAKKPKFVFAVALIALVLGGLLAWSFKDSSDGPFWIGIVVMVFGMIGIIRGMLLVLGKDFE